MYSEWKNTMVEELSAFLFVSIVFGAASVLLGTALLLGANAVKADETSTASTKTPEVTNSDKQKSDSGSTTPVVEELPELKIDAVKADRNLK